MVDHGNNPWAIQADPKAVFFVAMTKVANAIVPARLIFSCKRKTERNAAYLKYSVCDWICWNFDPEIGIGEQPHSFFSNL